MVARFRRDDRENRLNEIALPFLKTRNMKSTRVAQAIGKRHHRLPAQRADFGVIQGIAPVMAWAVWNSLQQRKMTVGRRRLWTQLVQQSAYRSNHLAIGKRHIGTNIVVLTR